jgi:hypothetical protein
MWTIFALDEAGQFQSAVGLFHSREAADEWNHRACDNDTCNPEFANYRYIEIQHLRTGSI